LVDDICIAYFLEDIGQELFITALVERIAKDAGVQRVRSQVLNATRGGGAALAALKRFLHDAVREQRHPYRLLVVAIDGNCKGYRERRRSICSIVERSGYQGEVICAIPDPHIERWYLADPEALRQVLGCKVDFEVPAYKCERDRYKQILRQVIQKTGVIPPLGGIEYGDDIAHALNFYHVCKTDQAFKHFMDALKGFFQRSGQSETNCH